MDWASLPWDNVFVVVTVLISGIGIVVGIITPAIGQAIVASEDDNGVFLEPLVASRAMNAIARQPEASDAVNQALILSLALLESLAIYVLAVILILLFANPLRQYIVGLVE